MENRGEDVRDSGMAWTVYETWEALFCTMRQKGIEEERIWKVFVAEEQRMDIREELMQLIRSQSGRDAAEEFAPDSDLMEDLGFDSIQIMELFAVIEETYGITFTDYVSLLDSLDSVSAFTDYVSELILSVRGEGSVSCEEA